MSATDGPWTGFRSYAEALRLHEAGIAGEVIAEVLGVDIDAVDSVLDMAARKLATIRDRDGGLGLATPRTVPEPFPKPAEADYSGTMVARWTLTG
ncbi:hypothetical protein ACFWVM_01640 [Nocardia fluminea]|uniref:hypothetical protein n=1 Tax=Nocardia fluminea TaxID=134984 RepID=UPI00365B093D